MGYGDITVRLCNGCTTFSQPLQVATVVGCNGCRLQVVSGWLQVVEWFCRQFLLEFYTFLVLLAMIN